MKLDLRLQNWELERERNNQENTEKQGSGTADDNAVMWEHRSNRIFENKSEWLTTAEAATYLRKFERSGNPSVNAIHKLVSQGRIRRRKFSGRLYFKRQELAFLIESSEAEPRRR